jgi:hypothetical protein
MHRENPRSRWRNLRLDEESSGNGFVVGHGGGVFSSPQRVILGFLCDDVKLSLFYMFNEL